MNKQLVLSYDVGTSSVKAVLVDEEGKILGTITESYPISYPSPGWAEQNPEDYWQAICNATQKLINQIKPDVTKIIGIVFSTQAMGIIPIDDSGKILHNNISWVDGRAELQANQIMRKFGGSTIFRKIVGLELTGKDVIAKLRWLKQERPKIYQNTKYILDVNGFLKYKATDKTAFEQSGACSYGFDLKKKDWISIIFKAAGFDMTKLPPVVKSTDIVGSLTPIAAKEMGIPPNIAVFGGCDDTQSAAMGSTAIEEGEAHIYLGTSAWVAVSTAKNFNFKNGAAPLQSADPLMNIVVGITESAGANLDWAVEQLYKPEHLSSNQIDIYDLMETEIAQVPAGSDHLVFTPWVLGERCPISTTTTRATIFNLSLNHSRAHIVKAILEGIGYNLRWIVENYRKDFKFTIPELKVLGGGSQSRVWMQILADIIQCPIETITEPKFGGAIGAASIAFVGKGIFKDFRDIKKIITPKERFIPNQENFEIYNKLYGDYQMLYADLIKLYRLANKKRFSKEEKIKN